MICDLQEDHPVCPLMPDQHHRKDDHRDYLGYDQGCSGNGKYLDGWARVNIFASILPTKFSTTFAGWDKDYCTYI